MNIEAFLGVARTIAKKHGLDSRSICVALEYLGPTPARTRWRADVLAEGKPHCFAVCYGTTADTAMNRALVEFKKMLS